jgi:hypothetical protein
MPPSTTRTGTASPANAKIPVPGIRFRRSQFSEIKLLELLADQCVIENPPNLNAF